MTNRTITSISIMFCGLVLLVVGAVLENSTLQVMGGTVMTTGLGYATGKLIASKKEEK